MNLEDVTFLRPMQGYQHMFKKTGVPQSQVRSCACVGAFVVTRYVSAACVAGCILCGHKTNE
jgi:hypothetical protein